MTNPNGWRPRKYRYQLVLFAAAMVCLIPLGLAASHRLMLPGIVSAILAVWVSIAVAFALADLIEDRVGKARPAKAIVTFVLALYVLPLVVAGLAVDLFGRLSIPKDTLVVYMLGYSVNILYCLFHRDMVYRRMAEFKAALYISAGIYALAYGIITVLQPSLAGTVTSSQVAAAVASFTMCRGIVEVIGISKGPPVGKGSRPTVGPTV